MLTACAVAPDQTDLAAASVAPTTRAAASCMPSKTGSSSVPSPYQTAGTRARPTWRTTAMYWGSCTVSSSLSVAGGGETMLTVGADRTPSASARAMVSRIRTGSKGCPAPKSYLVRASSQTTAVVPLTLSRASELAATVAGRLDRRQEGGAHPVLLKLADRRDRRARGRRHRVPQDDRVLARVAHHRRRAVNGLRHHLKRRLARHAQQDARVYHRLDQVEHVCGP